MIILAAFVMIVVAIAIILLASMELDIWYCNASRFVVFCCGGMYLGDTVATVIRFLEQYLK